AEPAATAQPRAVLERLKQTRIISIQDHDKSNAIDQEGMAGAWADAPVHESDRNHRPPPRESLAVELSGARSDEPLADMARVADAEAERLADLWMREATEVKHVKRSDIIRPARLYFAFKQLLQKYDAAAITYDSATLTLRPQKVKAWTPLAILELSK